MTRGYSINQSAVEHCPAVQAGSRRCHDVRVYDNRAGDGLYSSEGLEYLGFEVAWRVSLLIAWAGLGFDEEHIRFERRLGYVRLIAQALCADRSLRERLGLCA